MRKRKGINPNVEFTVKARDNYRCWYCGINLLNIIKDFTGVLDHQLPWSRGGENTATNLVAACSTCNAAKGDWTLEEYRHAIGSATGVVHVAFFGEGERDVVWLCLYRRCLAPRAFARESASKSYLLVLGDDGYLIDAVNTCEVPCPRYPPQ